MGDCVKERLCYFRIVYALEEAEEARVFFLITYMKVVEDSCYSTRYFATLDSKKKLHIRILEKGVLGREVDLQVVGQLRSIKRFIPVQCKRKLNKPEKVPLVLYPDYFDAGLGRIFHKLSAKPVI